MALAAVTIDKNMRPSRFLTLALIGWFLFLAVMHLWGQRPLWNDEQCIFINIQNMDLSQYFLKGLTHVQQFPKLYLLSIQQLSSLFDHSLLALRVLPFICMCIAFLLWARVAAKLFQHEWMTITFLMCWGASVPLVYYAAELKQYSMDVLVGAAFIVFAISHRKVKELYPLVHKGLMLFLPALALFSYVAVLFFVFPLVDLWRMKARREMMLFMGSAVVVLSAVYWFDVRVGNSADLRHYWNDYFISFSSLGEFLKTFGEGVSNLIGRWFAETPKIFRVPCRVFMALGLGYILIRGWKDFKKDGWYFSSISSIGLVIFIELVLLGALRVYAFSVPRTSLFFAPVLFCATVQALAAIKTRWPLMYWPLQLSFWAYLTVVSVGIVAILLDGDLGAQSIIWAAR